MGVADAFDVRRTLRRELTASVAANIRAQLSKREMSETQLAQELGFTGTSLYRRFTGESRWEYAELKAVATVLHTSIGALVRPG